MQECKKWQKLAEKREASYTGLISDHNYNWCNTFKKSKTEYQTMLNKIIQELQTEMNKLPPPTSHDFEKEKSPKKPVAKEEKEKIKSNVINVEDIDVSYEGIS